MKFFLHYIGIQQSKKVVIHNWMNRQAVQLLGYDPILRRYQLNPHALQQLSKLDSFTAAAIIGPYRTGKSTLLNVVLEQGEAFGVGNTTNAHTRGIWMTQRKLQSGTLVIIDCEGLGSLEGDARNDYKLCLTALLSSSILLYNSVGVIDETALAQFQFLLQIARRTSGKDFALDFPKLLWLLRDFTLELTGLDGCSLSQDEYLERALGQGTSQASSQKNRLRQLIKKYFPKRECMAFVRPLLDQARLQQLNKLSPKQLRPQFIEKAKFLKRRLVDCGPTKLSGKILDGRTYCLLLQHVVKQINCDEFPDLRPVSELIEREAVAKLMQTCLKSFDQELTQLALPLQDRVLKNRVKTIQSISFQPLIQRVECDSGMRKWIRQDLERQLALRTEAIEERNKVSVQQKIKSFLESEGAQMNRRIFTNYYSDFETFQQDSKVFLRFSLANLPKLAGREDKVSLFVALRGVQVLRRLVQGKSGQVSRLKQSYLETSRLLQDQSAQERELCRAKVAQLGKTIQEQRRRTQNLTFELQALQAEHQQQRKQLHEKQVKLAQSLALERSQFQQRKALFQQKQAHLQERAQSYKERLRELEQHKSEQQQAALAKLRQQLEQRADELFTSKERARFLQEQSQSLTFDKNRLARQLEQSQLQLREQQQKSLKLRELGQNLKNKLEMQELQSSRDLMLASQQKDIVSKLERLLGERERQLDQLEQRNNQREEFYQANFRKLQKIIEQREAEHKQTLSQYKQRYEVSQFIASLNKENKESKASEAKALCSALRQEPKRTDSGLPSAFNFQQIGQQILRTDSLQKSSILREKQSETLLLEELQQRMVELRPLKTVNKGAKLGVIRQTPRWSENKQNKQRRRAGR